jgi:TetR/AcrR family transcriptional regulator, regulator of biofilm formation and stress response
VTRPAHEKGSPAPSVRTRILRATLELIAEGSVDSVTHRAVATRAGVSPGSTTHHFSTRDDLVREAFLHYLRIAETRIRSVIERHGRGGDPIERVGDILSTIVGRDFASGLVRAEYELLLHASNDAQLAAEARAWEARLAGVLAEILEQGGVARPVRGARILLDLARGYELESMLDPTLTTADFRDRLDVLLVAMAGPGDPASPEPGGALADHRR